MIIVCSRVFSIGHFLLLYFVKGLLSSVKGLRLREVYSKENSGKISTEKRENLFLHTATSLIHSVNYKPITDPHLHDIVST